MKLQLKCETPIHVGSGRELEPFDYVIDSGYLIKFNKERCFSEIYRRYPEGIGAFSQWLEKMAVKMGRIEEEKHRAGRNKNLKRNKNQELSDIRKKLNLIYFCETESKSRDLAHEFLTDPKYQDDKILCLEKPQGNRNVREMIREGGRPFIPGSSIKGAIRTALAYFSIGKMSTEDINVLINGDAEKGIQGIHKPLMEIHHVLENLKNKLQKGTNINSELNDFKKLQERYQKSIGERVERFIFGAGFINNRKRMIWGDPKFDLLKFLLVSDAYPVEAQVIIGNVSSITRDKFTGGMKPPQSIMLAELFDGNSTLEFEIDFVSDVLLRIFNGHGAYEWIGLEKAFNRLFALNLNDYNSQREGSLLLKKDIIERIFESLTEFSKIILRRDREWAERFSDGNLHDLSTEISNLEKQEKLIRIGFSSGWHSTTIGLALSEREELRPYLQEIIYAFNLDLIQNQKKLFRPRKRDGGMAVKDKTKLLGLLNRVPDEAVYPKSRRVLVENRRPRDWMGWARIDNISETRKSQPDKAGKVKKSGAQFDDFEKKLLELKKKFSD